MTSELPIIILGAGLAGPAVCLSLLSSGYHCRLLELRENAGIFETTSNSDGGSITLSANSIRALLQCAGGATLAAGEDLLKNGKAAALHDKLRQVGYSYDRMSLQDDNGYRYGDVSVGEGECGGLQALRIMRGDLRKILLEECRTGGAEVEWGVKVTDIQETEHVELFTADGTSIKGSILIGADGIHSYARTHILAYHSLPQIQPIWSETIVVNGFLPRHLVKQSEAPFPCVTFSPAGFLMAIQIDPEEDKLAWGIKCAEQRERTREEIKAMVASGEALKLARAEYVGVDTEPIRSLLDNVDEENVNVWAPYGLPDLPAWHTKRTVVIGDAAHAMPPNGQGTTMAFEDAALLGHLIGLHCPNLQGDRIDQVLEHWQQKRQKRIAVIKGSSGKWGTAVTTKLARDGWAWWVKRWGMWLFISLIRCRNVKGEGFSGYDVLKEDTHIVFS